MRRILLILLTLLTIGCGATRPAVFVLPQPLPMTVSTYPQIIQVYSHFRLMCMLPENAEGTAILGIQNYFHSVHKPLDRRMYERIISIGCDQMIAYCGYKPNGSPDTKMVSLTITPVGECR